jgi:opacity protein-like surface antigen
LHFNISNIVKKIFVLSIFIWNFMSATAQQGWEIGLLGGVSYYFGDLNTNFNVAHPGASGTAVARYNFNNRVSLRASVMAGQVFGNDAWSKNSFEKARNLSFRSSIREASLLGEFNFLPLEHGSATEGFSPYLLAGLSVTSYNPQAKYKGNWVDLRSAGTEGQFINNEYGTSALSLVYGGGLKLDLAEKWSLNIEVSGRKISTDYLDDVSGSYPDLRDVKRLRGNIAAELVDRSAENGGERIGLAGRQRGNGKRNDAFATASIGLVFYFGDLKCPKFYR